MPKLNSDQQKSIDIIMSTLNAQYPFFASLYYQLIGNMEYTPKFPTAATDGKKIILGDKFFDQWNVKQQLFVIIHEICHCMWDHPAKSRQYHDLGFGPDLLPYDRDKMNQAQDYVINDTVMKSGLTDMPPGGLLDSRYGADRLSDVIYTELPDSSGDDDDDDGGGGGDGSEPSDHGGFDGHILGDPRTEQEQQVADAKRKGAISTAVATAKAMGKMPGALERIAVSIIKPEKPWRDLLADWLVKHKGGDEISWARLGRRTYSTGARVLFPSRTGYSMGCLVNAIDTSGSMSDEEIAACLGATFELKDQLRPREHWVIWWDTKAEAVDISNMDLSEIETLRPYGGGGTSYRCVPEKIRELDLEPDAIVCGTDGYVSWPNASECPWPHLTVCTSDQKAPFGTTIRMGEGGNE